MTFLKAKIGSPGQLSVIGMKYGHPLGVNNLNATLGPLSLGAVVSSLEHLQAFAAGQQSGITRMLDVGLKRGTYQTQTSFIKLYIFLDTLCI